jgi:hypothetical protein
MPTIDLPSINVPAGCEEHAAQILQGIQNTFALLSHPGVVSSPSHRTLTSSLEHSLAKGHEQALALASAAKRR